MKSKAMALAAVMSAALLCGCAQGGASDHAQENMSALIGVSMNNYVTESKCLSANSSAKYIENMIDTALVYADTNGYGMKPDASCTVSVTITQGEWKAALSDPDCFERTNEISWYNDDVGSSADDSGETDNALTILETDLAETMPEVENGYIGANIADGRVQFVYFTENTSQPIPEMEAVITSEEARSGFAWASGTRGVSQEGMIVGTSPIL